MNEFRENNKVSIEIANKIESYLKYWGVVSLIPIINTMSLFLDLPEQYKQLNSTLCISQRGSGKSTLLLHILPEPNKRKFQILPKKIFESLLMQEKKSYFHLKILIHDDIIVAFGGLSKKQREQLVNLFTSILSDGCYGRQNKWFKGIRCVAHFGIAKESYVKHHQSLLDSTFLDRFVTYTLDITDEMKEEILEHLDMLKEKNISMPSLNLPIPKKRVNISLDLDKETKNEINKLAMQLDRYNIMTYARAQNYIHIFLMSNALLNGRKETNRYDLEMYKRLHPYHIASCGFLKDIDKVKAFIMENPKGFKEPWKKLGISRSSFYRISKILRIRGEIK